jgi:hypothetical protein
MMGFTKIVFRNPTVGEKGVTFMADFPPQLKRGVNNMHIYASVVRPIHVGGSMVPLLNSLWLDVNKRDYNFGEVRSIVIKNSMYVPLASTSVDSIEINVRSDSGRLFPFIEGAVTSLTLHFKRVD